MSSDSIYPKQHHIVALQHKKIVFEDVHLAHTAKCGKMTTRPFFSASGIAQSTQSTCYYLSTAVDE